MHLLTMSKAGNCCEIQVNFLLPILNIPPSSEKILLLFVGPLVLRTDNFFWSWVARCCILRSTKYIADSSMLDFYSLIFVPLGCLLQGLIRNYEVYLYVFLHRAGDSACTILVRIPSTAL